MELLVEVAAAQVAPDAVRRVPARRSSGPASACARAG